MMMDIATQIYMILKQPDLKYLTQGDFIFCSKNFWQLIRDWSSYIAHLSFRKDMLVQNGKHVVMMGDDTWLQLFPSHFGKSYPFPSFNVKDLDTVVIGCIDHLIPSLYQKDWDILIAQFIGVALIKWGQTLGASRLLAQIRD